MPAGRHHISESDILVIICIPGNRSKIQIPGPVSCGNYGGCIFLLFFCLAFPFLFKRLLLLHTDCHFLLCRIDTINIPQERKAHNADKEHHADYGKYSSDNHKRQPFSFIHYVYIILKLNFFKHQHSVRIFDHSAADLQFIPG